MTFNWDRFNWDRLKLFDRDGRRIVSVPAADRAGTDRAGTDAETRPMFLPHDLDRLGREPDDPPPALYGFKRRVARGWGRALVYTDYAVAGLEILGGFGYEGFLKPFTASDLDRIRANPFVRVALYAGAVVTLAALYRGLATPAEIIFVCLQTLRGAIFVGSFSAGPPPDPYEIEADEETGDVEEADGRVWVSQRRRREER